MTNKQNEAKQALKKSLDKAKKDLQKAEVIPYADKELGAKYEDAITNLSRVIAQGEANLQNALPSFDQSIKEFDFMQRFIHTTDFNAEDRKIAEGILKNNEQAISAITQQKEKAEKSLQLYRTVLDTLNNGKNNRNEKGEIVVDDYCALLASFLLSL